MEFTGLNNKRERIGDQHETAATAILQTALMRLVMGTSETKHGLV